MRIARLIQLNRNGARYLEERGMRDSLPAWRHSLPTPELLAHGRDLLVDFGSLLFQSNKRSTEEALIYKRLSGHELIIA